MSNFTILTVCTGNVCRSPLAEHLLEQELRGVPGVRVASAGVGALVGSPMTDSTRAIAARLIPNYERGHTARQLAAEHVRGADLLLAMAREHRRAIAELIPAASRRTFTLREFARLADSVAPEELVDQAPLLTADAGDRMRDAVDLVASLRGSLPPLLDPADDDVVDPYRQSDEVYEQSADQLVPAVRNVADFLRRAATGGI
ncbi:low molecular weight phosphatase family protein [Microbacterium sp.]|jgi:protein-tyrosine phosphatase|uniref:arsenate reductase/protein-tyrosine-phosphatase family protein n=1 Tax=Microbacterium sp. TaxID=51671 RepID=UPI002D1A29F7|nr:low molecular weight phosphatase family protein [Microbacterium sp.]HWL78714.1 low molecular weight phosphatase family protein [Microbacterium sp.]